ncbi:MAG: methionine gamma-lyase, partial [Sphingobacteriia bacterium]
MRTTEYSGWGTAAIHGAGHQHADDAHHAPIYASSTFTFDSAEAGSERFA